MSQVMAITPPRTSRSGSEGLLPLVMPSRVADKKAHQEFLVGGLLGTGGFAKVYSVTDSRTGALFADKVIEKRVFKEKKSAKAKVEKEILLHRQLDHRHVVKFLRHFEDRNYVHILMELCPSKTLLHVCRYRKRLGDIEVKYYVRQILLGLDYLHSRGVLHRDLKLGNMLLTENMTVKIADFGLACTMEENKSSSVCGTPNYIAPEVLHKQGHSTASEVWSVGCMTYALLCGAPPFETESVNSTYARITQGVFNLPPHLSAVSADFILAALILQPDLRATVRSLLSHSFFSGPIPSSLPSTALTCPPTFKERPITTTPLPPSEFLHLVTKQLERGLANVHGSGVEEIFDSSHLPSYVVKWVDYSNKYGFGYVLSDGTIGVHFRDSSRISSNPKAVSFTSSNGRTHEMSREKAESCQVQEISIRMRLLHHISDYMERHLAGGMPPSSTCKAAGQQLVKWHRSADSVALQLSGDVLQVNSLSSHEKVVIWMQSGSLILTLLSPAGVASSQNLSGPWSLPIRQTVQAFLRQLGNLAVCGNN